MHLIPKPQSLEVCEGSFDLTNTTIFVIDPESVEIGAMLLNQLCTATGYRFSVEAFAPDANDAYVELDIDPTLKNLGSEGYLLEVSPGHVILRAPTAAGMFYATRTLLQLLPPQIFREAKVEGITSGVFRACALQTSRVLPGAGLCWMSAVILCQKNL